MASTASDSHGLPASTFLNDQQSFFPSYYSPFLDDLGKVASYFDLPTRDGFPTATAQEDQSPPPATVRKVLGKRPRVLRRPPATVLATNASNFRAIVQEFTGFPSPPPFAGQPHLLHSGKLLGAGPTNHIAAAPATHQLLHQPSRLKLTASHASQSPPNCTTSSNSSSSVLDAISLFGKNNGAIPAAAAVVRSSSQLY